MQINSALCVGQKNKEQKKRKSSLKNFANRAPVTQRCVGVRVFFLFNLMTLGSPG